MGNGQDKGNDKIEGHQNEHSRGWVANNCKR